MYSGDQQRSWHGTTIQAVQPVTHASRQDPRPDRSHEALTWNTVGPVSWSSHTCLTARPVTVGPVSWSSLTCLTVGPVSWSSHSCLTARPVSWSSHTCLTARPVTVGPVSWSSHTCPTEAFGWTIEGGKIGIEWDSQENLEMIRNSVSFLLKGCGCKTGCTTARYKCVKSRKPCGPGCSCGTKCTNQGMQHF